MTESAAPMLTTVTTLAGTAHANRCIRQTHP